MESQHLREFCKVQDDAQELLRGAITQLGLSARAYNRILKVSRTIADLAETSAIEAEHVSEAVQYRGLDRIFGTTDLRLSPSQRKHAFQLLTHYLFSFNQGAFENSWASFRPFVLLEISVVCS